MAHYEVEIKSLLGEKQAADALKAKMKEVDPDCKILSTNSQLNHYFEGNDVVTLYEKTKHLFSEEAQQKFLSIVEKGEDFSVRTRQKNSEVLLVVKASVDAGTSSNGVSRLEFEEPVSIFLEELDNLALESGFEYQAKWSREREEYAYKGVNVCIDKNAGYGYLAEFEKVVDEESHISAARAEIDATMNELGVVELPQDRLARMFDFYNKNWPHYYGTEDTFNVD